MGQLREKTLSETDVEQAGLHVHKFLHSLLDDLISLYCNPILTGSILQANMLGSCAG